MCNGNLFNYRQGICANMCDKIFGNFETKEEKIREVIENIDIIVERIVN